MYTGAADDEPLQGLPEPAVDARCHVCARPGRSRRLCVLLGQAVAPRPQEMRQRSAQRAANPQPLEGAGVGVGVSDMYLRVYVYIYMYIYINRWMDR